MGSPHEPIFQLLYTQIFSQFPLITQNIFTKLTIAYRSSCHKENWATKATCKQRKRQKTIHKLSNSKKNQSFYKIELLTRFMLQSSLIKVWKQPLKFICFNFLLLITLPLFFFLFEWFLGFSLRKTSQRRIFKMIRQMGSGKLGQF